MRVPPRLPVVVLSRRLCSANTSTAVAHAVYGPCTGTAQYRLCEPVHSPAFLGFVSWYGALTIGNATPDSNANTFVALALPTLTVVGPPLEVALPTTAPNSNNTPSVFYTSQELEATFFEDPELTMPRMPITRTGRREASSSQWESRRRLDWTTSQPQWWI